MKKSFQRTGTVVLAWIFVLTSNRAFQATVTYHFTANNFMDATSPYVTFVSVSGNFTVSSLLINVSGIVSVNSFRFSEGVNTKRMPIQVDHFFSTPMVRVVESSRDVDCIPLFLGASRTPADPCIPSAAVRWPIRTAPR